MKSSLYAGLLGAAFGGLLLFTGCADVAYEGGVGVAYYDYDYYPDCDVYFCPDRHIYYWYEGGGWRSGGSLPSHYVLRADLRQHMQLHSQQPWTEYRPARVSPPPERREIQPVQNEHHDQGQNQDQGRGHAYGHSRGQGQNLNQNHGQGKGHDEGHGRGDDNGHGNGHDKDRDRN